MADLLHEAAALSTTLDRCPDASKRWQQFSRGIDLLDQAANATPRPGGCIRDRIRRLRAEGVRCTLQAAGTDGDKDHGLRPDRLALLAARLNPGLLARRAAYHRYAALLPRPANGATLSISPPGFCWLPTGGPPRPIIWRSPDQRVNRCTSIPARTRYISPAPRSRQADTPGTSRFSTAPARPLGDAGLGDSP